MTTALACFLLLSAGQLAKPESVPRDIGYLALRSREVAVGEVHRDWPLLVVAEIRPPRNHGGIGWEAELARELGRRFASLPKLDPPYGTRQRWQREHGFYLCGPSGHPEDRFELAEVFRDGQKLTVTVEHWPTGCPIPAGRTRRPTQIVSVRPPLDPGEYDLTVVWREFTPKPAASPFWSLKSLRRATTKLTVHEHAPPEGERAVSLKADDFRPVDIEKAEAARLWAPVPAVESVGSPRGFEGFIGERVVGVAAGTFDPVEWKENLYSHIPLEVRLKNRFDLLARAAPVEPAKPTDSLYAVIYSPYENNEDHCRVRAMEWADGGFVVHMQFFHTGWVSGSNAGVRSGYVVRLPGPETVGIDGRKLVVGKVPVTVRWSVFHHAEAAFRPLGVDETIPLGFGSYKIKASEKSPRPGWLDKGSRAELLIRP